MMLTEFLNANKAIIENSNRTGWCVDNVKWAEASDKYRRMDTTFDIKSHFRQVTTAELDKARTQIDQDKLKSKGKGKGGQSKEPRTKPWQNATSSTTPYAPPATYAQTHAQAPRFIPTPPPTQYTTQQPGKGQGKRNRDGQTKKQTTPKGAGKGKWAKK